MLMITQTKQLCIFLIFIYFLDNNTVKQVFILLSISSWVKIKGLQFFHQNQRGFN